MEDQKTFRVRKLNFDITRLGEAASVLSDLTGRWPERTGKVEQTVAFLREIAALLREEGHIAYVPKEVVVVVPTAKELAEELEVKRLDEEAFAKAAKIAKLKADIEELEVPK